MIEKSFIIDATDFSMLAMDFLKRNISGMTVIRALVDSNRAVSL